MELDDRIDRSGDEVIVDRKSFRQLRWWREGKREGRNLICGIVELDSFLNKSDFTCCFPSKFMAVSIILYGIYASTDIFH